MDLKQREEIIGFVGLGEMGSRIVQRLLKAGYRVIGYNRTISRATKLSRTHGMIVAESPRAVAEKSNFVFSMVTNTDAVKAITQGPEGILAGLSGGKIFIDMTTQSPEYSRKLALQVAEKGARMLDAPVSGSVITLVQGKLSIMVGGDLEAFKIATPILEEIGHKISFVGENGLAVTMKIATNLNLSAQMLAFSESVLLAEKAGISREVAVEVLANSAIASPMIKYRGPFVLETPKTAWFNAAMMKKDLNLAQELGEIFEVPTPTVNMSQDYLDKAVDLGIGEHDFASMFNVLAKESGIPGWEPKVSLTEDNF